MRVVREHVAIGYINPRRPVTSISSFRRPRAGCCARDGALEAAPAIPTKPPRLHRI